MSCPNDLSAVEAAGAIARGELTSERLVSACLDRVDARDRKLRAWVIAAKSKRQSNRGEK